MGLATLIAACASERVPASRAATGRNPPATLEESFELEWKLVSEEGPTDAGEYGAVLSADPQGRPATFTWGAKEEERLRGWVWTGDAWSSIDDLKWTHEISMIGVHDATRGRSYYLHNGGYKMFFSYLAMWTGSGIEYVDGFKVDFRQRTGFGVTFDEANDRIIWHGGVEQILPPDETMSPSNETWTWRSGKAETLVTQGKPPASYLIAFGYCPKSASCTLLTRGERGVETWELLGDSWTQLHPETSPPLSSERQSQWLLPVWDPVNELLVVHGPDGFEAETWGWDGIDWRLLARFSGSPERIGSTIAWDPATKRLILYGGSASDGTWQDETYLLERSQIR